MISSRCNDNHDEFPGEEIEKGFRSFIGKPVFVNHHNEDHRRMRGLIIDAALHKDSNADGSPDIWCEGLMEIDALTYPKLAKSIIAGDIDRTSMGVDVEYSICSVCANRATTPLEYCRHIPGMKGAKLLRRTADGTSRPELVRERCHGLSFFENSLLVEEPADPTAYFLGSVELGPGLEHLGMTHTARRVPIIGNRTITVSGVGYPATLTTPSPAPIDFSFEAAGPTDTPYEHGGECPSCTGINTIAYRGEAECVDCSHEYSLRFEARTSEDDLLAPIAPPKSVKDMSREETSDWNKKLRVHSAEWHKRNPPAAANIVDHWHAATPEEKENGKNWYADAHHATKMLADHSGTPMHVAAGLVSNYSPQTHWATNIVTAATAMRTQRAVGGPGNKDAPPGVDKAGNPVPKGFKTTQGQKDAAHEMLTNHTHYNDIFTGPKTRAFAHLIEHGGDTQEDKDAGTHKVVVDRHALSVACGARASDAAYGNSGLGGKKKYDHVSGLYRDAAKTISGHEGEEVHPHQVQAVTWLVRQRLNEHHDRELGIQGSRQGGNARAAIKTMTSYFGEHHPEMSIQMPGTGYAKSGQPNKIEKMESPT